MDLIEATASHVKTSTAGDTSGHDWWHIFRVWNIARHIASHEAVEDTAVVELSALLHDIADWKFHGGDLEAGPTAARQWLESQQAPQGVVDEVASIVRLVSFKGSHVPDEMPSLNGQIVQDADRLDAMGAIGVARTFAFGGHAGRPMHLPGAEPTRHDTAEAYRSADSPSTLHFSEKLLLLRDRMHTDTARSMAVERHEFMERFLARFLLEWDEAS